ncbi:MAG: endonuclease/exonuclease/phosphatase (EEP) superfamily protein YafD [Flavobacteriaceae bacterium]|jgi:endonuclease/exonuclease/phosphatase (EEP) superfamily protein YafD
MKKLLHAALTLIMIFTSIFSVLGYFGVSHWLLDLPSHFKPQYLIVLVVGTSILLVSKKRIALIFAPFILASAFEVVPLYFGGNKNNELTSSTKIVCINLLSSNRQFEAVEQFIESKSPDIIVLQEFSPLWQQMLEPKFAAYPYQLALPRNDNFGIAVYSKVSFSELKELTVGPAGLPSIQGDFELDGKTVTLMATHPLPPVGPEYFKLRNGQLSELGKLASASPNEFILLGDLNTSSFSFHFKALLKESNLIDSRKGFGLLTTWPTWFLPAQTTLDHCLVSQGIYVKSREVGPDIGSDHLPIFIELGVE